MKRIKHFIFSTYCKILSWNQKLMELNWKLENNLLNNLANWHGKNSHKAISVPKGKVELLV